MDTIHGVICYALCLDQFILVFFNPYKMGYPELRDLGSLLYILSSYLKGKTTRLVSIVSSVSDYDFGYMSKRLYTPDFFSFKIFLK